jgi:KUP system potassium uptake protein
VPITTVKVDFRSYALSKKQKLMVNCPSNYWRKCLLADGIITPSISVSSAVEGIRTYYEINTVPIVTGIYSLLIYNNLGQN